MRGNVKFPAERLSRLTARHSIDITANISFDPPYAKMKYCLVSVPLEAVDSDQPLDALKSIIGDNGTTLNFAVPDFKIGTLDALVQQADDLSKLDTNCEGLVAKVADSLKTLLDDQDKVEEQKLVNDSMHPARSVK